VVIQGVGLPDRYAVIGHPVAHSRSPLVHRCFAEQTNQIMHYTRIDAPPEAFARTVRAFFHDGGHGLNVTLPHKEAALALADQVEERARLAGAVNTLTCGPGGLIAGDNTDGVGLVRDLTRNLGVELRGARILLLGAGGAARGVLGALLAEQPAGILIANRRYQKSRALAYEFRRLMPGCRVKGVGFRVLRGKRFDIVINATSASMANKALTLPDELARDALYYADHDTPFVRWAKEHGARSAHLGFGMLVEQAAESFYLWRGVRPQTRPVIALLMHA
jgi:shikimate dehydrogenase